MQSPSTTCRCHAAASSCCDWAGSVFVLADRAVMRGSDSFSRVVEVPLGHGVTAELAAVHVAEGGKLLCELQGASKPDGNFLVISGSVSLTATGQIDGAQVVPCAFPYVRLRFSSGGGVIPVVYAADLRLTPATK